MTASIKALIAETQWVDVHSHLVEERHRLTGETYRFTDGIAQMCIQNDWSILITDLAVDDLVSAGLPRHDAYGLRHGSRDPAEKWAIVAPYIEAVRSTGYFRCVDLTTERLFGMPLNEDTVLAIDEALTELQRPGYYGSVLREVAGVEVTQVNSLAFEDDPFRWTEAPDLLAQDISIVRLVTGRHSRAERLAGVEVGTLSDYLSVIDWCFEQYAPYAVAVKCQWAYQRPLAVTEVDAPPRRAYAHLRRDDADLAERRLVEDFLFRYCVDKATEYGLPVKLHTGSLGGVARPQLAWLGNHVMDLVPLISSAPSTTFVLMHMSWPQQEQLIALAKHFPNVTVEMSWTWNSFWASAADFLGRLLTTAPANKVLCFGSDYHIVESVVGHSILARQGLYLALSRLIDAGWLSEARALELVPLLMRDNAIEIFPNRRVEKDRVPVYAHE